jgi:CubicO group peptidase (beta-lactamase class C family)
MKLTLFRFSFSRKGPSQGGIMTLRLVGTWFGTLASMVLFASPAVAVTDGTCHAQTRKAREQCRSVLSALLPAVVIDDVRRQSSLSERLRRYQVPGISMAFIDSGHVSWLAVHGQRERNGEPINPQTVFQAASISKPVAATLALLVVGSGDLRLNTPVNAQLHSWQLPASDQLQPTGVTLRRLLSHRAGINVHEFPGYAADAPLPDEIQILDGQAPANSPPVRLLLQPGSAYRYSGGGYQIAQLLIEDAVGKPFGQVAQERWACSARLTQPSCPDASLATSPRAIPIPGKRLPAAGIATLNWPPLRCGARHPTWRATSWQ